MSDKTPNLPLIRFRDRNPIGENYDAATNSYEAKRGTRAECLAAEFLLEHRRGPRNVSINHPERMALVNRGRSHPTTDVEATCDLIELALSVVPASWRAVVLVSLAWHKGVAQLRGDEDPEDGGPAWLVRAGFPATLPERFTRYTLRYYGAQFRGALSAHGLLLGTNEDEGPEPEPSPRHFTKEDRMEDGETPLKGYPAIGKSLGVAEKTAQRWAQEGMPVHQREPGGAVFAYPSELAAWKAKTWTKAGEGVAG